VVPCVFFVKPSHRKHVSQRHVLSGPIFSLPPPNFSFDLYVLFFRLPCSVSLSPLCPFSLHLQSPLSPIPDLLLLFFLPCAPLHMTCQQPIRPGPSLLVFAPENHLCRPAGSLSLSHGVPLPFLSTKPADVLPRSSEFILDFSSSIPFNEANRLITRQPAHGPSPLLLRVLLPFPFLFFPLLCHAARSSVSDTGRCLLGFV